MKNKFSVLILILICGFTSVVMLYDEYSIVAISVGLIATVMVVLIRSLALQYLTLSLLSLGANWHYSFILMTPVLVYLIFDYQRPNTYPAPAIPLFGLYLYQSSLPLPHLILLIVVAALFSFKDDRYAELRHRYDDSFSQMREKELQLLDINESLTLTQNTSVRVAVLEERNRIARDIHDGVGHSISRGILQLGALLTLEEDEARREALNQVKLTLNESMDQLRRSVHNIVEENINLEESLSRIIQKFSFCRLDFTYELAETRSLNFNYSLLFIVQESLRNIETHSNANYAEVALRETADNIYILIRDNGGTAQIANFGLGLASIRNRVEALKGNLDISTHDGFRIFITFRKELL